MPSGHRPGNSLAATGMAAAAAAGSALGAYADPDYDLSPPPLGRVRSRSGSPPPVQPLLDGGSGTIGVDSPSTGPALSQQRSRSESPPGFHVRQGCAAGRQGAGAGLPLPAQLRSSPDARTGCGSGRCCLCAHRAQRLRGGFAVVPLRLPAAAAPNGSSGCGGQSVIQAPQPVWPRQLPLPAGEFSGGVAQRRCLLPALGSRLLPFEPAA